MDETEKKRAVIQQTLDELESAGVIWRTTEFRKNKDGQLEPVYLLTDQFKKQEGIE